MNCFCGATEKDKINMDEIQDEGFAGTLVNFRLIDLIQMCCLSDQSLCIEVTQEKEHGLIVIQGGEVIHAVCGSIKGEAAFFTILLWEKGHFESKTVNTPVEATIAKNHQFLLMEAARLEDEKSVSADEALDDSRSESKKENQKVIRLMIVDDSATMCRILSSLFASDDAIEIVATAENGESALHLIDQVKPDIITMDVNMPVMGGGTALMHIMLKSPCPVVIISNPNSGSQENVLDFLRLGAVDYIQKPTHSIDINNKNKWLISKIKRAANANTGNFVRARYQPDHGKKHTVPENDTCQSLLVINSGMGGFAELLNVISVIPGNAVSTVVFQDMPETLINPLVAYLQDRSTLNIQPFKQKMFCPENLCQIGCIEPEGAETLSQKPHSFHNKFDDFLDSILETFTGKLFVVLLSGAQIMTPDILERVTAKGGQVIIQKRSTCMLPPIQRVNDSVEIPVDSALFLEAEPFEIKKILTNEDVFCL